MIEIVPDIYSFSGLLVGRVYAIRDSDGLSLIDAGIPPAGAKILKQLANAGYKADALRRVLITHAHPDHVGGLPHIVEKTGAKVFVSEQDTPVAEGRVEVPRAPAGLRPPRTVLKGVKVDHQLRDGEILPEVMGGLQALLLPGHSPGHMAFWQPDRRILFAGDVLFHMWGMTQPPAFLSVDMAQNRAAIARLVALEPSIVCFGHGKPIVQGATDKLEALLARLSARYPA